MQCNFELEMLVFLHVCAHTCTGCQVLHGCGDTRVKNIHSQPQGTVNCFPNPTRVWDVMPASSMLSLSMIFLLLCCDVL